MKEIRTKIISGNNTNENKERSSLKLNPEEKKENDEFDYDQLDLIIMKQREKQLLKIRNQNGTK